MGFPPCPCTLTLLFSTGTTNPGEKYLEPDWKQSPNQADLMTEEIWWSEQVFGAPFHAVMTPSSLPLMLPRSGAARWNNIMSRSCQTLPPSFYLHAPHLNINTSSLVLYTQVQQANKGLFRWQIFLGFISWLPSGGSLTKALNLPLFCLFPAAEACRGKMRGGRKERLCRKKTLSGPRSASVREEIKILENTIGGSLSFWAGLLTLSLGDTLPVAVTKQIPQGSGCNKTWNLSAFATRA